MEVGLQSPLAPATEHYFTLEALSVKRQTGHLDEVGSAILTQVDSRTLQPRPSAPHLWSIRRLKAPQCNTAKQLQLRTSHCKTQSKGSNSVIFAQLGKCLCPSSGKKLLNRKRSGSNNSLSNRKSQSSKRPAVAHVRFMKPYIFLDICEHLQLSNAKCHQTLG